jgi:hypothetical protein
MPTGHGTPDNNLESPCINLVALMFTFVAKPIIRRFVDSSLRHGNYVHTRPKIKTEDDAVSFIFVG